MHFYKTSFDLIIIDFNYINANVKKEYYAQLKSWNLTEDGLKNKEKNNLHILLYVKHILASIKEHNCSKNIVFYVTDEESKVYLNIITKYYPFIVHYGKLNYEWITNNKGESREIIESVKATRFNFDYSKFTPRKLKTFQNKYNIFF